MWVIFLSISFQIKVDVGVNSSNYVFPIAELSSKQGRFKDSVDLHTVQRAQN